MSIDPYNVVVRDPAYVNTRSGSSSNGSNDIFAQFATDNEEFGHFNSHLKSLLIGEEENLPLAEEFAELQGMSSFHLNPPKATTSLIPFKKIDPACPNFIASATPARWTNPSGFWSSVWENGPLIVQLNSEFNYLGIALDILDNFQVMPLEKEELLEGKVVKTKLWLHKEGEKKEVTHYLIKDWEDGDAYHDPAILDFVIDAVKGHVDAQPDLIPTIHCTAGVGRTGTFLAHYFKRHLCVHANAGDRVDPMSFPRNVTLFLRMHRYEAVHTLVQYLSVDKYAPKPK